MEDKEKLINEHRAAVAMTGNISDFQLTNMKAWPFVLFDDIKQVGIKYNFNSLNNDASGEICAGTVSYDIEFNKDPEIPKQVFDNKIKQLEFWTKYLFWQDTKVEILKKGKKWEA